MPLQARAGVPGPVGAVMDREQRYAAQGSTEEGAGGEHGEPMNCKHCARVEAARALTEPTPRELADAIGTRKSENTVGFAQRHDIQLRVRRVHKNPRAQAKERLITLLKERPNICAEMSLTDIGKELGVTRERIRQLMPEYSARRAAAVGLQARVAAFVEEHPEVTIPKWMGGMTYREAGEQAGVHFSMLASTMRNLGYRKGLIVQTKEER